jgi:hypothetical protein
LKIFSSLLDDLIILLSFFGCYWVRETLFIHNHGSKVRLARPFQHEILDADDRRLGAVLGSEFGEDVWEFNLPGLRIRFFYEEFPEPFK